jgi:hypothetical protein
VAEHSYPERAVASPPGHHITIGLRVPHQLPGGKFEKYCPCGTAGQIAERVK